MKIRFEIYSSRNKEEEVQLADSRIRLLIADLEADLAIIKAISEMTDEQCKAYTRNLKIKYGKFYLNYIILFLHIKIKVRYVE